MGLAPVAASQPHPTTVAHVLILHCHSAQVQATHVLHRPELHRMHLVDEKTSAMINTVAMKANFKMSFCVPKHCSAKSWLVPCL